jgi:hypothetical protein
MQPPSLALVQALFLTDEEHIDCRAVMEVLARYVEISLGGEEPGQPAALPPLDTHFQHCEPCAEVYRALRELAHLEAQGRLPEIDFLYAELRQFTTPPGAMQSQLS